MTTMKAISLHQPWASMIAEGEKTIETRNWATKYRGPLLICSTFEPVVEDENGLRLPRGKALAVCDLVSIRPMERFDEEAACCNFYWDAKAWILKDIRAIKPFPVIGERGVFDVELPPGGIKERKDRAMARKKVVDGDAPEPEAPDAADAPAEDQVTSVEPADQNREEPLISNDRAEDLFVALAKVERASADEVNAKQTHDAAKKARDVAQADLQEILADIRANQSRLFSVDECKGTPGETEAAADAWREVEIEHLGIPQHVQTKLLDHEPPLRTLGDFADWRADKGKFWAKDIEGVGSVAQKKIEDAYVKFWATHPEYCQPTAVAEGQEPTDETSDEEPAGEQEPEAEKGEAAQ